MAQISPMNPRIIATGLAMVRNDRSLNATISKLMATMKTTADQMMLAARVRLAVIIMIPNLRCMQRPITTMCILLLISRGNEFGAKLLKTKKKTKKQIHKKGLFF